MRRLAVVLMMATGCGDHSTAPCQPAIVYLDQFGGSYDHGAVDDATANLSVLLDMPRTLPPWPTTAPDWGSLTACIRTALAPFPIEVTETDPGTTSHYELVFTSTYWAGDPGTTEIVPSSCRSGHQVEFVFGDALPDFTRACQIAMIGFAEMAANLTLGDNCTDWLDLAKDCVPLRSFVDTTVNCVDDSDQPTACRCGGGTTENVYQSLAAQFPACPGADLP